jgi:two-component system, NtrC family, sensor histidine kinase HydH
MRPLDWMFLFGAAGQLTLAGLCLTFGKKSPVARPLLFLCLTMFGWCFTSLAWGLARTEAWGGGVVKAIGDLDAAVSALSPPFALHLVVTFVGARRAYMRIVRVEYAFFAGLSLSSALALVIPAMTPWKDSWEWAATFLVGWVPALGLIVVLLVRHLVSSTDPDEKGRTRMMLAAIGVAGVLATSDIARDIGFPLPHLAPIGALVSAILVANAVFRVRLFERDLSGSSAVYAVALGVFRVLGSNIAALALGTVTVTVALGVAVYEMSASAAEQRARVERLVALGRFSSQMAHDLKNPLASLKGALQFLEEERQRGRSLDDQHEFLGLMLDQVERLGRVADEYERVGRVEPRRRRVDVNQVVGRVIALEPFAARGGISIVADLAPHLPPCDIDADLVARALENLVRNALEAMPDGGNLTVRTAVGRAGNEGEGRVIVSVEDCGTGMDARQAERAFNEFYTTKATGSGLGLAFVKRVAEAHGGDASLKSKVGEGTVVEMRLPALARGE